MGKEADQLVVSIGKKEGDFSPAYGGMPQQWIGEGKVVLWRNPLNNKLEKIPADVKVSMDHQLPKDYFLRKYQGLKNYQLGNRIY